MKKIIIILLILILISFIIFYFINKNSNKITEYTPQEEISDEQLMQTEVVLYFKDKDKDSLGKETRLINAKELVINPYSVLMNLLNATPKLDNLEKLIPDGTKINRVEYKNGTVYIDFSKEFIDNCNSDLEDQNLIIYSIVNTITQLTEVNGVKILINGEENLAFKDNGINFNEVFVKID